MTEPNSSCRSGDQTRNEASTTRCVGETHTREETGGEQSTASRLDCEESRPDHAKPPSTDEDSDGEDPNSSQNALKETDGKATVSDWHTPEEVPIDLTRPPGTDEEMGWETSAAFRPDPSTCWQPEDSGKSEEPEDPRKVEKPNFNAISKIWRMALERGFRHVTSCRQTLVECFAHVAARREFHDGIPVVYGDPPSSKVYIQGGIPLVIPTADTRYVSLPPDPFIAADISQLLGLPYTFVNTRAMVKSMLDALPTFPSVVPLLSIDLEGLNLGKQGSRTYLMQIYDSHSEHLYIVDLLHTGLRTFDFPASNGKTTLRTIMQSTKVPKLFCDVRADSRALFKKCRIRFAGIKDVQNIEIASRRDPMRRQRRAGLSALIHRHADLSDEEMDQAREYKESGRRICQQWGYVQFSVRPLRGDLAVYAGNDVLYLPRIYSKLISEMSQERLSSADMETEKSIRWTHNPEYDPNQIGVAANWHHRYADDELN